MIDVPLDIGELLTAAWAVVEAPLYALVGVLVCLVVIREVRKFLLNGLSLDDEPAGYDRVEKSIRRQMQKQAKRDGGGEW